MNALRLALPVLWFSAILVAEPIRLHPENPHYFEFKGKPLVLITSAEHYGALINLDFDFRAYLDTLRDEGMNYTRIFMGPYVENPSSFGIQNNTLGPKSMRLVVPWKRSRIPGYANGGNKFDLTQWDETYFDRLRQLVETAATRDIIVEITLFSSTYRDDYWELSPFHPENNVNGVRVTDRKRLQRLPVVGHNLLEHQERYVRKLVRELNSQDNVFFEIQNEPWSDNEVQVLDLLPQNVSDKKKWTSYVHVASEAALAWQARIAEIIEDEESSLPKKHLIAQNFCNFKYSLPSVPEAISIINFHYAWPEAAYWNLGWNRVVGFDESGFRGPEDAPYRKQAWHFMMAGGGLFNNLDYSFVAGFEDGTFHHQGPDGGSPGGGSPELRQQLRVLGDFLRGFDYIRMQPDQNLIRHAPGVIARGLAEEGRQYAIFVDGRGSVELALNVPRGSYAYEWVDTGEGTVVSEGASKVGNEGMILMSPAFESDIALRILRR